MKPTVVEVARSFLLVKSAQLPNVWSQLIQFKTYFSWVYNRAQMFTNMATVNLKLDENLENFQSKCEQFILMLISIAIYNKSLGEL